MFVSFARYVFLFVFFAVFSSLAMAAAPVQQARSPLLPDGWRNTSAEACTDHAKEIDKSGPYAESGGWKNSCVSTGYPWRGVAKCAVAKPWPGCEIAGREIGWEVYYPTRNWCPGSNTAPDTSKPLDQQCAAAPPQSCKAGQTGQGSWPVGETAAGAPIASPFRTGGCVNSCVVEMKEVHSCWGPASGEKGGDFCNYTYALTGDACTSDSGPAPSTGATGGPRKDVPPFTPSKGSCPAGTVQGGVAADGTPVCIGTGSDPKNSPPPAPKIETEKTTQNADGSTTTTKTTTTTNADGSTTTTTTTTTKGADGTVSENTTKNTSDKPSGGAGKDDSARDDEKYDLCKQNPLLTICRNSSVSGSCEAVTCQGDAIQCATLQAAAKMQCQIKKDREELEASSLGALGKALASGSDPQAGALPSPKNATVVNVPSLNQDGWLGGGGDASPFKDITVDVLGNAVVIPLEKWTGYLVALRYALMMVAALVSFRQLSGAVMGV